MLVLNTNNHKVVLWYYSEAFN